MSRELRAAEYNCRDLAGNAAVAQQQHWATPEDRMRGQAAGRYVGNPAMKTESIERKPPKEAGLGLKLDSEPSENYRLPR